MEIPNPEVPVPRTGERRAALVVEDFSKEYESHRAVDGLSFRVAEGEILGLVGPNGAGKTTTLRSIVGVLPIQSGRVVVCGHDLAASEVAAKSRLAWIPDDPQPFDTLTVLEHLRFSAALYGIRDWKDRAERLLERFELTEKRAALGGELSRGMRQKLAFCMAWIHEPGLVLMDEPLSGLDPRAIRSAKDEIRRLAQTGTAVVLSSHQLELIQELADRILIIDRGTKRFEGTLGEARATLSLGEDKSLEDIFLSATDPGPSVDRSTAGTRGP
ncbi:MAG: ABC transporter ATP-binding protein [Planctomycetota bacterium]|nr:ABC transporter ATP-binding protein [Planctomycetota bacterium]